MLRRRNTDKAQIEKCPEQLRRELDGCLRVGTRGFPKIRGTLIWGPYNKDPTIQGTILESPIYPLF